MARQTRRRRDSKSKNRYRPRFSSASGRATSEQSEVMPRKIEKVNWTTVFILLAISSLIYLFINFRSGKNEINNKILLKNLLEGLDMELPDELKTIDKPSTGSQKL